MSTELCPSTRQENTHTQERTYNPVTGTERDSLPPSSEENWLPAKWGAKYHPPESGDQMLTEITINMGTAGGRGGGNNTGF